MESLKTETPKPKKKKERTVLYGEFLAKNEAPSAEDLGKEFYALFKQIFGDYKPDDGSLKKSKIAEASVQLNKYISQRKYICSWEGLKELSYQGLTIHDKQSLNLNMLIILIQEGLTVITLPFKDFEESDQISQRLHKIIFETVNQYEENSLEFIWGNDDEFILSFMATMLAGNLRALENITTHHSVLEEEVKVEEVKKDEKSNKYSGKSDGRAEKQKDRLKQLLKEQEEQKKKEESENSKTVAYFSILDMIDRGEKQTKLLCRLCSNPDEFHHFTRKTSKLFDETISLVDEAFSKDSDLIKNYFKVLQLYDLSYVSAMKGYFGKKLETKALQEELKALLPQEGLSIKDFKMFINGSAITMIDGTLGVASELLTKEDENPKKTARFMLVILHELCHKKRVMNSVDGKYFIHTPTKDGEKEVEEAGRFMEREVFGEVTTHCLSGMTTKLAELLINVKQWDKEGYKDIQNEVKDIQLARQSKLDKAKSLNISDALKTDVKGMFNPERSFLPPEYDLCCGSFVRNQSEEEMLKLYKQLFRERFDESEEEYVKRIKAENKKKI